MSLRCRRLTDRRERLEAQRAEARAQARRRSVCRWDFETQWGRRMDARSAGRDVAVGATGRMAAGPRRRGSRHRCAGRRRVAARSSIEARIEAPTRCAIRRARPLPRGDAAACRVRCAPRRRVARRGHRQPGAPAGAGSSASGARSGLGPRDRGCGQTLRHSAAAEAWQVSGSAALGQCGADLPGDCAVSVPESALSLCAQIEELAVANRRAAAQPHRDSCKVPRPAPARRAGRGAGGKMRARSRR